jgi:hypothetical protein
MVQSIFDFFPNSLSVSELSLSLPIWDGNFNKNYRLPLERLYGRNILEDHDYRKEPSLSKENFVLLPDLSLAPTILQCNLILKFNNY